MASQILDHCNLCGACATVCPTGSISLGSRHYVIDSDSCTNCMHCAEVCPVDAIQPQSSAYEPKK